MGALFLLIMGKNIGGYLAAGAQVMGSLIGGAAQAGANKKNVQIARETNAANMAMLRYQNEFDQTMLEKQNAYSSPVQQRQRFEDAGINPYFALGQISSGTPSSSLESASAAPMQGTTVQPGGIAAGLSNAMINAASVMNAVSDARLKNEQANSQRLANASFAEEFANRMSEIRSRIGLNNSSSHLHDSQKNLYDFDFKFRNDTLANAMRLSDLSVSQGQAILDNTMAQTNKARIESDVMSWDLKMKKKYDESFLKSTISNLIADVAVKYQNIRESNNRMRNDNIRTSNDSARVGIEQFNAITSRKSVDQQAKMITAEVAKIYSEKYGVDIDNSTRHAINKKVFEKINAEVNNISANTDWIPFNNVMNGIGSIVGSLGVGFGAGFLGRSIGKRPKIGFR